MRSEGSAHLAGAAPLRLARTLTQHLCTANPPPAPQKSLVLAQVIEAAIDLVMLKQTQDYHHS